MPTIKGYQQYAETDVINLFKTETAPPITKGTFVKIVSGFMGDQNNTLTSNAGQAYAGTVSPRWSLQASVTPVTATGDVTIGMLLYDVRTTDENGENLFFNPRKAAENNWILSGQAAPIVTKGFFYYSGISGTVSAGSSLFLNTDGAIQAAPATSTGTRVGKALGPKDSAGFALIQIDV